MELNEVMRTAFSAREFTDDPVSDQTLYEILGHARFAPTGGNRQGGRVIVVREPQTRDALARLAEPAARRYAAQLRVKESPWNSVVPTRLSPEAIEATKPPAMLTDSFRSAPVVLVFVVDLKLVASMDQFLDRVGVISGASIYPLVWNTLLGVRQAGLGGTITTLAVACEPEVQALLGIPEDHAVAAVVPIGRPVKQLTRLSRRPVEEFVFQERFAGEPLRAAGG